MLVIFGSGGRRTRKGVFGVVGREGGKCIVVVLGLDSCSANFVPVFSAAVRSRGRRVTFHLWIVCTVRGGGLLIFHGLHHLPQSSLMAPCFDRAVLWWTCANDSRARVFSAGSACLFRPRSKETSMLRA